MRFQPDGAGTKRPDPSGASPTQRRRVSPAEQTRRQAWGHEWGPRVGASIRAALAEQAADQVGS